MTGRTITPIGFNNPSELLEALIIYKQEWLSTDEWDSNWIFRGQWNSAFDLSPSVLRQDNKTPQLQRIDTLRNRYSQQIEIEISETINKYKDRFDGIETKNVIFAYAQGWAEYDLIIDFIRLADNLGHPVPGADFFKNRKNPGAISGIINGPRHFSPYPNSAVALAQHNGIPTRCLDWTRNPYVAAFFAAEAADPDNPTNKIAIWAINTKLLKEYSLNAMQVRENCQFKVLTVPRSDNSYLHAQDGLFIFPVSACEYYIKNGCWPTLEDFCFDIGNIIKKDILLKYTLPCGAVGELLRLLWSQRISRAHLMPVYENVTKSLVSKWKWFDY